MNATRLERASSFVAGHADGQAAVANLAEIVRLSTATSAGPHVLIDTSLARGLSYYTGAIMEIAVPDLAGSLGGGGRYDGLNGMFSGENLPACGFSLGLERILVVMSERNMFPESVRPMACGSRAICVTRGFASRCIRSRTSWASSSSMRRRAVCVSSPLSAATSARPDKSRSRT